MACRRSGSGAVLGSAPARLRRPGHRNERALQVVMNVSGESHGAEPLQKPALSRSWGRSHPHQDSGWPALCCRTRRSGVPPCRKPRDAGRFCSPSNGRRHVAGVELAARRRCRVGSRRGRSDLPFRTPQPIIPSSRRPGGTRLCQADGSSGQKAEELRANQRNELDRPADHARRLGAPAARLRIGGQGISRAGAYGRPYVGPPEPGLGSCTMRDDAE